MSKQQVDHYGVHLSSNGLWFLIQGDEQNERGLQNVKSNITVKTHRSRLFSHTIRLGVLELDDDLTAAIGWLGKDKLGKLLLPNPDNAGRVVFVEEDTTSSSTIYHAVNLTTPSGLQPIRPAWMVTLGEARGEYRLTNVQPFIITDVTPRWMAKEGAEIASLFRSGTRPLIFIGSRDVVLPREVEARLNGRVFKKLAGFSASDLQKIGSYFLQSWMKNGNRNH